MQSRDQYEAARREFERLKSDHSELVVRECEHRLTGQPPFVTLSMTTYAATHGEAGALLGSWMQIALKVSASLCLYPSANCCVSMQVARLLDPEEVNHVSR